MVLLDQSFGLFPCIACNRSADQHGRIPQAANLSAHLAKAQRDVEARVPRGFGGYVVLDYESWRSNWGWTNPSYRNASAAHALALDPTLRGAALTAAARRQYEAAATAFLRATLRTIRRARPALRGLGMYDYPLGLYYPFGFGINGSCPPSQCPAADCPHPQCGAGQRAEDERQLSLYREMTALYPSLYLTHPSDWNATDARHNHELIMGTVAESFRIARLAGLPSEAVCPYTWYRYHDKGPASLQLLSDSDAALEFSLASAGPLDRVQNFLIYGAETDQRTPSPQQRGFPVEQTMAFFTRHAALFNGKGRQ